MKLLIALLAASALCAQASVKTGLDVLVAEHFAPLKGKHIGLITNHTGLSSDGQRNVDLMLAAGVKVVALFSPEHGFFGKEDQPNIGNAVDPATHLPIYSLHEGKNHRMTPEMLKGVDTVVYDIQDVGARFYTYSCTMTFGLQEAARLHLPFYVLDRPNPITGNHVEGPVIDEDLKSYVGCAAEPIRHGFTFGELARFVNGEQHLGADLHVIKMQGWKRSDWWDATNLTWIDPSPNMNSLSEALLYPGLCLLERNQNFSVGRGTKVPYEQVGADWLDGRKLAAYLNARNIPGVRAYANRFTPNASHFQGKTIEGVRFIVTDREIFNSVRLGLELIHALVQLYPGKLDLTLDNHLIGSSAVIKALESGEDPRVIESGYNSKLQQFLKIRQKYLLYGN